MNRRFRWTLALLRAAALTAAGILAAQAATAQGSFQRTLKVTGPVELEVTTASGSILVRPGEADSVEVRGAIEASSGWFGFSGDPVEKVRALEANPPIEQNGNVIRVGRIEDRKLRRNVSISYELVVPVATRLRADTGSGEVEVAGLDGPVNADSGSGSLKISNIKNEVRADTGSGDIALTDITGPVSADTGSGSIRASAIAGAFSADTGSGDVLLQQSAPGAVKIDTGSGSVEVSGVRGSLTVDTGSGDISAAGEPAGEWTLQAGSGSIHLRLPAQAAFDLDAHTGSGTVHTEHPITLQGSISPNKLRGKIRGGGVLLSLETGSGDIRIE